MKSHHPLSTASASLLSLRTGILFVQAVCQCLASLALLASSPALANDADVVLVTRYERVNISIDGLMDEPEWADLPYYNQLVVLEPDTLETPERETQYRFLYTDEGLYVGFWNEQSPETFISRLSARDSFMTRDDISFTLDPTGQGLYGYWFNLSLSGSVIDGTVLPERQFSSRWDGPWTGKARKLDDGWSAEMFLPWSMMSMPEAEGNRRQMGFYVSRSYAKEGERWGYPALPGSSGTFLSQLQKIEFENVNPSSQFTFYPFAAGTYDKIDHYDSYKAGFDLFWRPSTNIQLTSTLNPDFGNVESDNIVVNLTSFETFFSEKRAFFLEGQEIFSTSPRNLGGFRSIAPTTTLLNTRRIGSPPRSPDIDSFELTGPERNQPTALQGAAKVTGQQGRVRYGLLAALEKDTKLEGTRDGAPFDVLSDGRDFGVARVLYEDTSTGARRSLGWMTTLVSHPDEDSIVHGLDAHLLSNGGGFSFDAQLMASDTNSKSGTGGFVDFSYTPKQGHQHSLQFDYFDENLDINDFGFLRRNDARGFRYAFERSDSSLKRLKSLYTRVYLSQEYNSDGRDIGSGVFSQNEMLFDNNHLLALEINYLPSHWDDRNSSGNGDYREYIPIHK